MESVKSLGENANIKELIKQIEQRPCLWNPQHGEYSCKDKRIMAWVDICNAMYPGYEDLDYRDKTEFETSIKKKWKCLKDCFRRDVNKNNKEPGKAFNRYRYFNKMKFLLRGEGDDSADVDTKQENSEDSDVPITVIKKKIISPTKKKTSTAQKKSTKTVRKEQSEKQTSPVIENIPQLYLQRVPVLNESTVINEDDEDRLFLLSLIKDLKKIPEDYKLEAKCEIMTVVRKFKMVAQAQYTIDSSFSYEPVRKKIKKKRHQIPPPENDDDSNESYNVVEYGGADEDFSIDVVKKGKKIKTENPLSEEELIL